MTKSCLQTDPPQIHPKKPSSYLERTYWPRCASGAVPAGPRNLYTAAVGAGARNLPGDARVVAMRGCGAARAGRGGAPPVALLGRARGRLCMLQRSFDLAAPAYISPATLVDHGVTRRARPGGAPPPIRQFYCPAPVPARASPHPPRRLSNAACATAARAEISGRAEHRCTGRPLPGGFRGVGWLCGGRIAFGSAGFSRNGEFLLRERKGFIRGFNRGEN